MSATREDRNRVIDSCIDHLLKARTDDTISFLFSSQEGDILIVKGATTKEHRLVIAMELANSLVAEIEEDNFKQLKPRFRRR